MQKFIGTKRINAKPMNRLDYNKFRGWELPADEDGSDDGYLVEYLDGGKPNTTDYSGYVSWSPKEQFDNAYRPILGLTFGEAVEALKAGKKVTRAGWNGFGMWLILVPGMQNINVTEGTPYAKAGLTHCNILSHIDMWTGHGMLPGWLASQTDMLADDWAITE